MLYHIATNEPILKTREYTNYQVARFWNNLSVGWNQVWGPHIHHGYFDQPNLSPLQAQERLIDKLVEILPVSSGMEILDVGCGMGGSAIYLADNFNANVLGITLSHKQVEIATSKAFDKKLRQVSFRVDDALAMRTIKPETFDLIWSLESCEQFFDKPLFIEKAYKALKPGGKLMLATWCSSEHEFTNQAAIKYQKLCRAFDLPYMPTVDYYEELLIHQGFQLDHSLDWSSHVKKSWQIGLTLLNAYSLFTILKVGGWRGLKFVKQVHLMKNAFEDKSIRYAVFIATKA